VCIDHRENLQIKSLIKLKYCGVNTDNTKPIQYTSNNLLYIFNRSKECKVSWYRIKWSQNVIGRTILLKWSQNVIGRSVDRSTSAVRAVFPVIVPDFLFILYSFTARFYRRSIRLWFRSLIKTRFCDHFNNMVLPMTFCDHCNNMVLLMTFCDHFNNMVLLMTFCDHFNNMVLPMTFCDHFNNMPYC
jgi:hypothetical protein